MKNQFDSKDREKDGSINTHLSIKERIILGDQLIRSGEKLNPYPRYEPFVKSFSSFKDYEKWKKRQRNPWLI